MKLTTRTRYSLRLMLALARHYGQGFMFLKDVAREENLSEKYLSQIVIPLRGAGLVHSGRGVYGGYKLAKPPGQITVREITEPLEGKFLVDCVGDPSGCKRASTCASRDVWALLSRKIYEILEDITLQNLVDQERAKEGKNGIETPAPGLESYQHLA